MPGAFKQVETASRRTCTACSIRRNDQPSRPSAKDLLFLLFAQDIHRRRETSVTVNVWFRYPVGRFQLSGSSEADPVDWMIGNAPQHSVI